MLSPTIGQAVVVDGSSIELRELRMERILLDQLLKIKATQHLVVPELTQQQTKNSNPCTLSWFQLALN